MALNPFYSISEAAKILGISEEMVRILLGSGKIKGLKINGVWKIPQSSLSQQRKELFDK